MNRVHIARARSIWLFDMRELNPRGKNISLELIHWLRDEYKFIKVPQSPSDINPETKSLDFVDGSFTTDDGRSVFVALSIYNDGVIADTRSSTRDTDAFLEDSIQGLSRAFDLEYLPEIIRTKAHISEINFHTENQLDVINPKLRSFAEQLTAALGGKPEYRVNGVTLAIDPLANVTKPGPFTFERKINTGFSGNLYFSQAPLDTEEHLRLLAEFERLLLS